MAKMPITVDPTFVKLVSERSGENIRLCYYCQKCTVGCPTAYAMDYKPVQVLRMVQLGLKEALLQSSAIWLCVSCEACGTRCPYRINLAPVMDTLKYMALEEGYAPAEREVFALHQAFLNSIRLFGRVHEATMLAEYKVRSADLFSDLDLGADLILKGKIPLLPERIKGLSGVRKLFKRVRSKEA